MNENYGYGCNYILSQIKRFDTYGIAFDNGLYDLVVRDPDYVIKTLLYGAQGYFGVQTQYEVIMYMMMGSKYFPSNIVVPVRHIISENWNFIVTEDFYRVMLNNLSCIIHPGTEDIERMLMGLNYDRIYEIYEWDKNFDNAKFIMGFIRSISYDLVSTYTGNFFVDEDQLRTYLLEEMSYETGDSVNMYKDPLNYIEFSTILYNSIANSGDITNSVEDAITNHLGFIYNKYANISFYDDPFKNAIETKVFRYVLELLYDMFESIIEYLIVNPNKNAIMPQYYEEHKLNVGKAIRVLMLPITETGVYHAM